MSTAVAGPSSTPATERPPGASHRRPRQYHGRHPRNPNPGPSADVPSTDGTLPQEDKQTPAQRSGSSQRKPREPSKHGASAPASGVSDRDKPARRSEGASTKPRRIPRRDDKPPASDGSNQGDSINRPRDTAKPPPPRNKRAARFNATLTEPSSDTGKSEKRTTKTERYARQPDKDDDLTTILTKTLSYAPYADCPICFASVHPAQPTWSCSPSSTAHVDADHENGAPHSENAQCCWTTFHLKCIRSWAEKSVKDVEAAWRDRGETRRGEWRCPGCQTKREVVPRMYWCFCGSTQDPKPPRLSTPHSCANPCTRPRVCGHPCPLACHPGPCPPCMVTTQLPCFCGKHSMSFLCSRSHPGRGKQAFDIINLSCGSKCGKALSCGNHVCQDICHDGECAPCSVREPARCWCGKEERELACGQGEEKESIVLRDGVEVQWVGKFGCENVCAEPYDCGVHTCPQSCHPPSRTPPPCPRSTSLITHCPCGKHLLSDPSSAAFFPPGAKLLRESCSDAVPTCKSLCMKPLDGCEHLCAVKCHTGDCPPCTIPIVRPCRCGSTTRQIPCHQSQEGVGTEEILCEKPCRALRNCGNHQCNRICCPLASLAAALKGKNKKRADATPASHDLVDEAGWHTCDLVCGKPLECGNHLCEERDHRGPCPTCLRSSFEEMVCHCGRTVLEPPIPCGTRINCSYPCSRAPPECGHPAMPHGCHEDDVSCPPCAFLTEKLCACGKKTVPNQRCSSQKVSCGTPCDKLLACGFHRCERLCHSGLCGSCTATCGKARKLCLPAQHACTHPCHAPSSCPETEPCTSLVTISCQCGRMRQSIQCGRCTTNQAGRQATQQLKCTTDCELAKRNARLAEALGISPDARKQEVVYPESVISFARANPKFVPVVEKAFFDFVTSEKKVQTLPHMPESRRRFVHDLAAIYRMDTQMVDQEPNRSVQLIRRVDTRLPTPLLSASLSSSSNALGKLTNLRATSNAWSRAQPALHAPAPALGTGRGWTSVAAKPVVSATRSSVVRTPPRPSSATLAGTTAATQPMPVRLGQVGAGPGLTSALPTSVSAAPPAAAVPEDVPDDWEDDA